MADSAKQRFAMKPIGGESGDNDDDDGDDPAAWLIRANQGHSIRLAPEGLHAPVTRGAGNVPAVAVHGTYFAFWDAIVAAGGLRRMGRTHVHFGTGLPPEEEDTSAAAAGGGGGAGREVEVGEEEEEDGEPTGREGRGVISGMRADAELLIFVDVEKSLRDGVGEGGGRGLKWWLSANDVLLTEGDADGVVPLKYFREVRGRRQGVGVLWKDGEKVADLPDGVVKRVPYGKTASGGGGSRRGGGGGVDGGKGRGGRGGRGKGGRK